MTKFKNNNSKNKKRSHYYWEILCFLFGVLLIYFGMVDEINHRASVSYNSKGMMIFHSGLMTSFYGLLITICALASIYGKIKNLKN